MKLLMGLLAAACSSGWAGDLELLWEHRAESNIYSAPVVADVHASAGLESIICDSAKRELLCVSAAGKLLWSHAGGWKKRLISQPAVGTGGKIVVANGDGSVQCIDGATGKMLWRCEAGAVEWGGVLWAPLDDAPGLELVVGTEGDGVIALDANGGELWRQAGAPALHVRLPMAAADVNGDGKAEVFGVDQQGPFALGPEGRLLWRFSGSDDFMSAVIVADAERDGKPELYCLSREENFLWSFSALEGNLEWRAPLLAGPDAYSGAAIAAGDLNGDGRAELVACDSAGRSYAFSAKGELLWTHETGQAVHASAVIGNINADDSLEVLVASGDHGLYVLSSTGVREERIETGLRITAPPTVADLNGDGLAEVLLSGNDRVLRCFSTRGGIAPDGETWPARGINATQCASAAVTASGSHFDTELDFLVHGDFEEGKVTENPQGFPKTEGMEAARRIQPRGWHALQAQADWGLQEGASSGKVLRAAGDVTILSEHVDLPAGLKAVRLEVRQLGTGTVGLEWAGSGGVVLQELRDFLAPGWDGHVVDNFKVPFAARSVQVLLQRRGEGETQWDDVLLTGTVRQRKRAEVLVNQAGYDSDSPKSFVLQTNFRASRTEFEVVNAETGQVCHRGEALSAGGVIGRYESDWGHQYWRGDFQELREAGQYRVKVSADGIEAGSYAFRIAPDLLWNMTSRPAYRFFYYQRCGMAIPGYHEACHLDDAQDPATGKQYTLAGGWHDAGDYNKYHNAPHLLSLARAYGLAGGAFRSQDEDGNGQDEFLEELLWGAAHAQGMIADDGSAFGEITSGYGFWGRPELETDNLPSTGDERPIRGAVTGNDPGAHTAALARVAVQAPDSEALIEAARRGLKWSLEHGQRGVAQFSTALDLYTLTKEEEFAGLAKELVPAPAASVEIVDALERYDAAFGEDHRAALREALVQRAESMLPMAENVFGVYTYGTAADPNFFNPPEDKGGWHVGNSSYILEAATVMALAHRYQPDPRYLKFVVDQFNWILGVNPFNISLMEGVGSAFLPTYHHRYTAAGVPRGAVPGSVVNGVTWRAVGDDRPFVDMSGVDIPSFEPNECWLPHNTNYLNALVSLHRALAPGG